MAEISPPHTTEERCTQLEKALETRKKDQTQRPKIQRVAHYLRARESFSKHYSPKLLSIGPIHHLDENMQLGEQYKLRWTAMYVESTKQPAQTIPDCAQTLHKRIVDNIKELKDLFTKDAIQSFNDEELSWMLFVDGCSLLQILDKADIQHPEKLDVKVDQLVLVVQDVLLLENQLPFQVLLKLLSSDDKEAKLMEAKLLENMDKFLQSHHLSPNGPKRTAKGDVGKENLKDQDPANKDNLSVIVVPETSPTPTTAPPHTPTPTPTPTPAPSHTPTPTPTPLHAPATPTPTHLLDHLHRTIVQDRNPKKADNVKKKQKAKKENNDMITHRNLQDLQVAGIGVKPSNSRCLRDIIFTSGWFKGELVLPTIIVDDSTAPTFLNLIAYEMCPDFENHYEVCSFVAFLDSLIDHTDDVKELRSAGILYNSLGSDEEVATLFNTISTDLVPDSEIYADIRAKLEEHYTTKWKTWTALFYHDYFSNPWAFIGFLAAAVALLLTFVQTWFAIPRH